MSKSFCTSLVVLSLISVTSFCRCKKLWLGAGAGAGEFVAPDFGPDHFGGDLLVAIEY